MILDESLIISKNSIRKFSKKSKKAEKEIQVTDLEETIEDIILEDDEDIEDNGEFSLAECSLFFK